MNYLFTLFTKEFSLDYFEVSDLPSSDVPFELAYFYLLVYYLFYFVGTEIFLIDDVFGIFFLPGAFDCFTSLFCYEFLMPFLEIDELKLLNLVVAVNGLVY